MTGAVFVLMSKPTVVAGKETLQSIKEPDSANFYLYVSRRSPKRFAWVDVTTGVTKPIEFLALQAGWEPFPDKASVPKGSFPYEVTIVTSNLAEFAKPDERG